MMQASTRIKASSAQLTALAEHMQAHPPMSAGISSTLQGRVNVEKSWISLAAKLNSIEGPNKTVAKWKQTWRDMRNNVKKKVMSSHNANEQGGPNSTGHGTSTMNNFSQVDAKVLSVIDPVDVDGLEDVVYTEEPKSDSTDSESAHEESQDRDIFTDVLYLEEKPPRSLLKRKRSSTS